MPCVKYLELNPMPPKTKSDGKYGESLKSFMKSRDG
jgi:hypothetical protein